MTELRFKVGDEVRLIGLTVTEIDPDSEDERYLIADEHGLIDRWVGEEQIAGSTDSDDPIVPGTFVVRRTQPGRVGKVVAVKKGEAWIDWAPSEPDTVANSASQLHTIRKLTEKEVRQLGGVTA